MTSVFLAVIGMLLLSTCTLARPLATDAPDIVDFSIPPQKSNFTQTYQGDMWSIGALVYQHLCFTIGSCKLNIDISGIIGGLPFPVPVLDPAIELTSYSREELQTLKDSLCELTKNGQSMSVFSKNAPDTVVKFGGGYNTSAGSISLYAMNFASMIGMGGGIAHFDTTTCSTCPFI